MVSLSTVIKQNVNIYNILLGVFTIQSLNNGAIKTWQKLENETWDQLYKDIST